MRLTPQRRAVLTLILGHRGVHWTADQIRDRLRETMPELSRGTTYKTLNALVEHGILEELATVDGSVLYGLRLEPHHHFVCESCRRWYDVDADGVAGLRLLGPSNHVAKTVDVTFRGICAHCQSARNADVPDPSDV